MNKNISVKDSNPKDAVGSTKVGLHYLPLQVLLEASLGLTEGGMKYGAHNYRIAGVRASIYFDAAVRHLFSWYEGEDIDPDSGLSHVTKTISCLMVLRDAMMNDMMQDDRPPSVKNKNLVKNLNELSKQIINKYPDPVKPYTKQNSCKR